MAARRRATAPARTLTYGEEASHRLLQVQHTRKGVADVLPGGEQRRLGGDASSVKGMWSVHPSPSTTTMEMSMELK